MKNKEKSLRNKGTGITKREFLGTSITAAALTFIPEYMLGRQNEKFPGDFVKNGIPENEIWLLVQGDDIGACHAINMGFKKAIEDGILTSAEVMAPTPWFEEAVEILNQHPETDVGVHLTLTSESLLYRYGAVGLRTASFLDKEGNFFHRTFSDPWFDKIFTHSPYSFMDSKPIIEEVEKELRAQIEMVLRRISHVTHLSTHMDAAVATSELKSLVERLGKEYGLIPVHKFEKLFEERSEIEMKGNRINIMPVSPEKKEEFLASTLKYLEAGLWQLVTHPGLDTPELRALNSGGGDFGELIGPLRGSETNALTSKMIKKIIKDRDIKLVNYRYIIERGLL